MHLPRILALAVALGTIAPSAVNTAVAQTARQVATTAESTMVLTGQIDVGAEGQVEAFRLDKRDQVPPGVVGFVETEVNAWRFEPVLVDGQPAPAQTPVTLRLNAQPQADGSTTIALVSANFQRYRSDATDRVTSINMSPPAYPRSVYARSGGGEVLLLIQVDPQGRAAQVFAEQVNLRWVGPEPQMRSMRDTLARAAESAARNWTFRAPATGPNKDNASWNVRVPVRFAQKGDGAVYGKWHAYIPGPRESAPWRPRSSADAGSDLLAGGGVYMADLNEGPRLLTPLGG